VSKTQFVSYSKNGFWAYDVALAIFLKHLIDAAEASDLAESPWLSDAIPWWRTVACISDYGLTLGEGWSEAQHKTFIALAEDACQRLSNREAIPAKEIVAWPLLDDQRIFPRGATEVATRPIIELGRAVIALVSGTLPEPPTGTAWLYGTDGGRRTRGMKLASS
jgi:hypothetical protein